MLPKRVRQFIMNLTDRINENDYKYIESKLNNKEYEIFKEISKSEQKHSVRVAREIENIINEIKKGNEFKSGYTLTNGEILDRKIILSAKEELIKNEELLIKAGLLHDVGKSRQRINIIDKSIIVILNKLTKGKLRNINLKKIQCYYNHSEYSYEILKEMYKNIDLEKKNIDVKNENTNEMNIDNDKINKNNDFLEVIRNHHNENYGENKGDDVKACENESSICSNDKYYLGNIIRFFQGVDDGN